MTIDPKKRGLGRGLGALLPSAPAPAPATTGTTGAAAATARGDRTRTYFLAGIEQLYPSPEQPRRRFDDAKLGELAETLRAHGVVVPLVVRPRAEGGYFLIAGERRWRAAQRAGLREVPVVVQDIDEREAFERAIVENVQRDDLGPIDEASAYQRLIDQFGLSQEQVATRIGKDRSTIANSLRLLKLPPTVRGMVEDQQLSMGHARALLGLDDAPAIERAARSVVDKGLSVRATEALVKKAKAPEPAKPNASTVPAGPKPKTPAVRDLEERLTRALGGPVTIIEDAPGKSGLIEIRYLDLDHLDKLLDRLL